MTVLVPFLLELVPPLLSYQPQIQLQRQDWHLIVGDETEAISASLTITAKSTVFFKPQIFLGGLPSSQPTILPTPPAYLSPYKLRTEISQHTPAQV